MGGEPSESRRRSAQKGGLRSPPVHVPAAGALPKEPETRRIFEPTGYRTGAHYFTCLDPRAPREALGRPLAVPAAEVADRLAEGFVILDVPAQSLLPIGDADTAPARMALYAWRGRQERVRRVAEAEGEDPALLLLR